MHLVGAVCMWCVLGALGERVVGRGRAGIGGVAQSESIQPAPPPYRRNGNLGLSGMAIADITLLSGFQALRADLEKVQPPTATSLGALLPLCSDCKC